MKPDYQIVDSVWNVADEEEQGDEQQGPGDAPVLCLSLFQDTSTQTAVSGLLTKPAHDEEIQNDNDRNRD